MLVGPGHDPERAPAETRPSQRSAEHATLAGLGVPAGKLSLLAPIEAKSVIGTMREEELTDRAKARAKVDAYLHWRDLADTGRVSEWRAHRIVEQATGQYAAAKLGFADAQDAHKAGREDAAVLLDEAQEDLSAAVRRYDDARADLAYLTDPVWRDAAAETLPMNDYYALDGARRRFAKKDYRGQVY